MCLCLFSEIRLSSLATGLRAVVSSHQKAVFRRKKRQIFDVKNSTHYERSEFLIMVDGKNSTQEIVRRRRPRRVYWPIIFLETTVRTILPIYSGARDPSGERQRAASTPQQWGPPSLHKSFRRAIASTVHAAAVGSAKPTQMLPASDSEHRPRRSSGVRLAYRDSSGERQRAPSSGGVRLAYRDTSGER